MTVGLEHRQLWDKLQDNDTRWWFWQSVPEVGTMGLRDSLRMRADGVGRFFLPVAEIRWQGGRRAEVGLTTTNRTRDVAAVIRFEAQVFCTTLDPKEIAFMTVRDWAKVGVLLDWRQLLIIEKKANPPGHDVIIYYALEKIEDLESLF